MIRIQVTLAVLFARIDQVAPTWRAKAATTREENRGARKFVQSSPSWSDIKPVYVQIQRGKCAYCERRIASGPRLRKALYDFDVEHFRPKNRVEAWPTKRLAEERRLRYDVEVSTGTPRVGYYLLSHEPLNYLVACKPCNSGLKANYFPVASQHNLSGETPSAWAEEWPYLIHPLAGLDDDPEDLIAFHGVLPQQVELDSALHDHWRARITIDFFHLDHESLVRERAELLVSLFLALRVAGNQSLAEDDRTMAKRLIASLTGPDGAHSSCCRAFASLFVSKRDEARLIAEAASELISTDPGV